MVKKKHKTQFKLLDPFLYFEEDQMIVGDGKPWRAPEGDYMAQDIPEWMPENVLSMIDYRWRAFSYLFSQKTPANPGRLEVVPIAR